MNNFALASLLLSALVVLAGADNAYTYVSSTVYYTDSSCSLKNFVGAEFAGYLSYDDCKTALGVSAPGHQLDGACYASNNDLSNSATRDAGYNYMRVSCIAITDKMSPIRFRQTVENYLHSVASLTEKKLYIEDSFIRNSSIASPTPANINCYPADMSARRIFVMDVCIPKEKEGKSVKFIEEPQLYPNSTPTGYNVIVSMNYSDTSCSTPVAIVGTPVLSPTMDTNQCYYKNAVTYNLRQIANDASAISVSAISTIATAMLISFTSYFAL